MSDSDSSQSRDYQNFRQITRDRLLHEMLRTTKVGESKATWKVLIMDKFTVRIMSYSCKMADITEEGVSLVEDLSKRRQPMPSMDAVYFIQPLKDNVKLLLSDMSGASPLYKKAYIFFSSPAHKELVSDIKSKIKIRVGALKEMNLEYFAIDSQGFITGHERALEKLFREREVNSESYLQTMGTRIATVFASLREFPVVRYSASRSRDASTEAKHRDLLPTKVAAGVWNFISEYKSKIVDFPKSETCELLILDRSVDQVAPIIHEWTYDAMCHDLLDMEGNKYVYEAPNKMGKTEKKEVLLEDHDPLWLELRHAHIADASERLHEKMTNFISKNKAAQIQQGSRDGSEISTRDLHKMVQALPQYSDQIEKLSLHVEIAGKINKKIRDIGLRDIGQLEQDLVFGDAGTKDVINFLRTNEDVTPENKLRLLMIYAAIYPQKFDGEKGSKLLQLAKLSEDDMKVVHIMKNLEGSESKKTKGGVFSLKFDVLQKKHACRKRRINEEPWQLSQFYPMIEDLIEKLHKGELSEEEYPCINDSSPSFHGASQSLSVRSSPVQGISVRTTRTTATWARPRASDDGYSSDSVLRYGSVNLRKRGQRIFIFIIGGATRSELRVAHKLTAKLGREVILGSSSLDDPPQFITKLKMLTASEFSLEDLEI